MTSKNVNTLRTEAEPGISDHERSAKKPRFSLGFTIQTPKDRIFSTSRITKRKGALHRRKYPVGNNIVFLDKNGKLCGNKGHGKEAQP